MIETRFIVYHRRATQLSDAMELCMEDISAYSSAAVLLAVHCAISYNDAILIRLGGTRPHGENHREAITALKRACTGAKIEPRGIAQLQKLLSAKTDISYGDKSVDEERITALCTAAQRFVRWAEQILQ
jgi:HEPN domain-containing protein